MLAYIELFNLSKNLPDVIIAQIVEGIPGVRVLSLYRRGCADLDYGANEDRFVPDSKKALVFLRQAKGETPQNTGGLVPHTPPRSSHR